MGSRRGEDDSAETATHMITWEQIEEFEASLERVNEELRAKYNNDPEIKKRVDAMYVPDCYPTLEWCISIVISQMEGR